MISLIVIFIIFPSSSPLLPNEVIKIECNVCTLDALQTELAEIDENVVRTELSVIEYGELLERRSL